MVKGLLASDCHTGPLLPILSFKDQFLTFVLTLDSAIVCGRAQAGNEQKIKGNLRNKTNLSRDVEESRLHVDNEEASAGKCQLGSLSPIIARTK